ncbi:MAG: cytochrome P450 [Gilvibacter sp.]
MATRPKYTYPPRLPLLRFFKNAEAIRKNPIPFHRDFFNKYGDSFSVKLGRTKHLILSRDKEVVQHILKKQHKNYYKSNIQTNYLSKYLGFGLLTINGDFWLKQRRLIQPAFHKEKMQGLIRLMQQTIKEELSALPTNATVDAYPIMNHLAFKIVANSLFDISIEEVTLTRLQLIIEKIQHFLVKEVRLPHKGWWFKVSGQIARHKKLAHESREIIQQIIEQRKHSDDQFDDLLDLLLATRYEDTGEPMSMRQLIDEITILFVAGHETTANALSFTLHLLAKHPKAANTIFEEVTALEKQYDQPADRLPKMEYTKACLEESMRLFPPAWITDRENLEDDQLAGYHIKTDTLVGVSFYELHRNPAYWDKPDDFIPERFLGDARKQTSGIYFPFGAGPRMCIGMGFAMYEMMLAIGHIVSRYELETTQDSIELLPLITLKPKAVHLKFIPRT